MKFGKKIGLSFLLLTFLTLATGCIGLLFINRVLNAFGAVSVVGDSSTGELAGLNRHVHEAIMISQEISYDKQIEDILELRKEFTKTLQEFDRSFNRIRKGIEDEMYLGTLESFKTEQNELKEQTHELIDAIIEELQAENAYRHALAISEQEWFQLVIALRRVTESLAGPASPWEAGRAAEAGPSTRETAAALALRPLIRTQQLLMEMRLQLKGYLSIEDPEQLPPAAGQLETLHKAVVGSVGGLAAPEGMEPIEPALAEVQRAVRSWANSLLGRQGLLELYRRGIILRDQTDELAGRMRSETADTLRMLDSVIALGNRLAGGGSDRGFVTAAPTLLVLAVALATVLSVALAVVLSHAITRPVRQMIAVTEAVRRGDFSRRLAIRSGDELAVLGEAFNRMVEEVNRSQEEIRSLNAGLEQRVRERTAELEEEICQREKAEREMRQKQEQLIQAGKLASLGVLVAGVAHEISNPNQAIMMGSQLLRKAWPDMRTILDGYYEREGEFLVGGINYSELRQDLAEHFNGVVKSARRIDTIIQGLKDFARQDRAEMTQIVNLNLVVRSALILLDSMLRKATDNLTVSLSPRICSFRGNAQRVEQVVINLIQNACQALEDRRKGITVSTYNADSGDRVVLEVRDEGVGIPREDLAKIPDPFFTTKREAGGTGLGLSVTSTIVKEHRGKLEFSSQPGKGTTARVLFPSHPENREGKG